MEHIKPSKKFSISKIIKREKIISKIADRIKGDLDKPERFVDDISLLLHIAKLSKTCLSSKVKDDELKQVVAQVYAEIFGSDRFDKHLVDSSLQFLLDSDMVQKMELWKIIGYQIRDIFFHK